MKHCLLVPLLLLATVAGCAKPEPAQPALWEVTGAKGEHGWLFGTIHTLPREADWRSATVNRALAGADVLVLEIADLDDDARTQAAFQSLAHSPGQPPLSMRVDPALRPALLKLMEKHHIDDNSFADVETWAAALTLGQLEQDSADTGNGIDRALIKVTAGMPRAEFEGAERQLSIFDRLPEQDQRDMLNAALRDDPTEAEEGKLAEAWRKGDMATIEHETHTGVLADPELRKALYSARNQAWDVQLEAMLRSGRRPFVAVGAAHMAGDEGLPALLTAHGWKVVRIQ